MTAIYASYSKNDRRFALGTDNYESKEKKKVSKIRLVDDRYVVTATGSDNPICAIDFFIHQDIGLLQEIENIESFISRICEVTKGYTAAQVEEYKNDESAKPHFQWLKSASCTLIVFDLKEFVFYECQLENFLPVESLKAAVPVVLPEDKLLLFSMANTRNQNKRDAVLPQNFYANVKATFNRMIKLDQDLHDGERLKQGEENVPLLGDLGSYCYFKNGKFNFYKNL